MTFTGFSKKALSFLSRLGRNNTREWFQEHRDEYESEILEPAKAFVTAMGAPLDKISTKIKVDPRVNGSIRRIARDTRFSADKTPYKDHLDFFFIYEGAGKEGPGHFLRITAKAVFIGSGTYLFDKSALSKYREAVAHEGRGAELAKLLTKARRAGYDVGGEHYKRVPRGFDPEHERADLLRFNGLYIHKDAGLPKELATPAFTKFCSAQFAKGGPVADWLDANASGK